MKTFDPKQKKKKRNEEPFKGNQSSM